MQTTGLSPRHILPFYVFPSAGRKVLISFSKLEKKVTMKVNSKRLIKLFCKVNRSPFWGRSNPVTTFSAILMRSNAQQHASPSLISMNSLVKGCPSAQWHVSLARSISPCPSIYHQLCICFLQEQNSRSRHQRAVSKWMPPSQTQCVRNWHNFV